MSDWHGWYLEVESKLEVLDDRLVAVENLPIEDKLLKMLNRLEALESRAVVEYKLSSAYRDRLDILEARVRALEMQTSELEARHNSWFNGLSGRLNSVEIVLTSFCEIAGRLLHLLRRPPGE